MMPPEARKTIRPHLVVFADIRGGSARRGLEPKSDKQHRLLSFCASSRLLRMPSHPTAPPI